MGSGSAPGLRRPRLCKSKVKGKAAAHTPGQGQGKWRLEARGLVKDNVMGQGGKALHVRCKYNTTERLWLGPLISTHSALIST